MRNASGKNKLSGRQITAARGKSLNLRSTGTKNPEDRLEIRSSPRRQRHSKRNTAETNEAVAKADSTFERTVDDHANRKKCSMKSIAPSTPVSHARVLNEEGVDKFRQTRERGAY